MDLNNIPIKEIIEGLSMIVAGATVIARLTPTDRDDKILEKARKIIETIGNLFLPDRKKV